MNAFQPPPLTWSVRRLNLFRGCMRQYYYFFYGSMTPSPMQAQIRNLTLVRSREDWLRLRVREIWIKLLREPASTSPTDQLLETLRSDFRHSQAGQPGALRLFEHEYAIETPDHVWREGAEKAVDTLEKLLALDWTRTLRETPTDQRATLPHPPYMDLRGLKVQAAPAMALRKGEGILTADVTVWRDELRNLQQGAWALFAQAAGQASPPHIQTVALDLDTATPHVAHPTEDTLDAVREYIHESADEMLFPVEEVNTSQELEEAFELAETEQLCHTCPFLRVCPRWR